MQHRTITLKKHTQHDTVDYDTVPPLVNKFAIRHTALHDFAGAYCIKKYPTVHAI